MTSQLGMGKSISFYTVFRLFFTLKDYYDNIVRVISSKYSVDEKTEAKIRISYIYSSSPGERTYCFVIFGIFVQDYPFYSIN